MITLTMLRARKGLRPLELYWCPLGVAPPG